MAGKRPLFVQRVREEHPGKQVEVWFQDEARFGQQGTLTSVWGRKGSRPSAVKQTRYKWLYLYAAVNPLTGESVCMIAPTVNTQMMNLHLEWISREVGEDRHVVLVLDQAGWHRSRSLKVPSNITLLPLPPYSPELNPVERVWCWMRMHDLSNRVFADHEEMFAAATESFSAIDEDRYRSICRTEWIERVN